MARVRGGKRKIGSCGPFELFLGVSFSFAATASTNAAVASVLLFMVLLSSKFVRIVLFASLEIQFVQRFSFDHYLLTFALFEVH